MATTRPSHAVNTAQPRSHGRPAGKQKIAHKAEPPARTQAARSSNAAAKKNVMMETGAATIAVTSASSFKTSLPEPRSPPMPAPTLPLPYDPDRRTTFAASKRTA